MPRDAEISLARSAAPISLSEMQKSSKRLSTAVRGTDCFVCVVAPSWSADFDDPDFWDPGLRAPICYDALVARSQAPATLKGTRVVLTGGSNAQVLTAIKAAIQSGELPTAVAGVDGRHDVQRNVSQQSRRSLASTSHALHARNRSQILRRRASGFSDSRNQTSGGALDGVSDSSCTMVGRNPLGIERTLNNHGPSIQGANLTICFAG